ncbi:HEAT repeat domain-containing protein [Streptomyces scabiei]|uniref:HEAT repeat domain-containing protein n=1 Tax=Streptomyces scabiei TaxID=1930 RepID=UPI0029AD44C0|nr:HEAT repeat domain-containing protein [Streptomyces scabiei]MDX3116742.1 HEAT repeat domain-containing protein [Streptomyces scabiei]
MSEHDAFATSVAARQRHMPTFWMEPHLLEQDVGGSGDGRVSFPSFATQLREAGEVTWIVHGAAGSGKTTALRGLEIELLRSGTPVLFLNSALLRQARIVKGMDVPEFVKQARPAAIPENLWKSRVKHRKVVVLLDGLNEMKRDFPSGRTWRLIGRLAGGNHGFTVAISSRNPDESVGEFRWVRRLRLQEFQPEQVREYLTHNGLDADAHLTWLDRIGLSALATNPLLLRGLVKLVSGRDPRDEPDPGSRAELVRAAAHAHMLPDRVPPAVTRHVESGATVDAAWAACAALAHFTESGDFTRQEVLQLMAKSLPLELYSDLLDFFLDAGPVEPGSGRTPVAARSFALSHQRYAECGLAVGWGHEQPPPITYAGHFFGGFVADWSALQTDPVNATADAVGIAAAEARFDILCDILIANAPLMDPEMRVKAWRALGRGFTMSRIHRTRCADAVGSLPRVCLGEGLANGLLDGLAAERPEVWSPVRHALLMGTLDGRQLQKLMRQAERRRTLEHTRAGLEELASPSPEGTVTDTGDTMSAVEQGVADTVAESSADIEDADTGDVERSSFSDLSTDLLITMLTDKDKTVCGRAVRELGFRADEPAVLRLCESLADLGPEAIGHRVRALGRIGSPAFIPALAAVLDHPEPPIRGKAITAIGRIGGAVAAELVRANLQDQDPFVQGAVLTALGRCGDMQDLPQIIEGMNHPDKITQYSAIGAVGRYLNFRRPSEKRALFSDAEIGRTIAALKDCEPVALAQLCRMLRTMAAPARGRLFNELIHHPAAIVRGAALIALEAMDGPLALDHARAMLDDEDDVNRGASITVIGRNGGESDAARIRVFLKDASSHVRGSACLAVARLADVDALDPVIELLQDEDRIVRGSACMATALLNGVQAVPALIRRLDDREASVRGSAAKALGLLGAVEGVGPLCLSLADEVARVRGTCAVALGLIEDPAAVPSLIPLVRDCDAQVRKAAVFALGKIGDPVCVPVVSEALRDKEAGVRWTAATALSRVGDPSVLTCLVPLLKDPEPRVRGATATALGWLGHRSALAPLVETSTDENAIVRGSVATALGRIADRGTVGVLAVLSQDKDAVVRSSAVTAVGRARLETGMGLVEAALVDVSAEVRGAAVRAMARLNPSRDLRAFLADAEPSVRRAALAAIGEGTGVGESALILALQDDDEEVRGVAVAALGRRHTKTAMVHLEEVLEDPSENVGEAAVQSLGQIVEQRDRPSLIGALSSAHRAVRLAAVELLAVDCGPVRQALEVLVRHPDARTRAAAAQALGRIGDLRSAPILIETLTDPDSYVRGFTATALSRIGVGSDDARAALLARLDDPVEAVVALAARALGSLGGDTVVSALQRCARDEENSLWTRATAVQAVAPLFHRPQSWLRTLADEYRGFPRRTGEAKFRGAVIDAVIRAAWDDDVAQWIRGVLLEDSDAINQTAAATGLAKYGKLSIELAKRFLATSPEKADNSQRGSAKAAPRRSDAATGAVLRGAVLSAAGNPVELAGACLVVSQAVNRTDSSVLTNSALSALNSLDAATARDFLDRLDTMLTDDARHRCEALLRRERASVEGREASEDAYRTLSRAPERFLHAFTEDDPRRKDAAVTEGCDIGVITIISEEAKAVRDWLERENPAYRERGPGGRFVYRATIPLGLASPRIVMTQAVEQGHTSAAEAAHYLSKNFAPRFLVLLGIAGAIHSDVSLGDVVIGTQVIDYGPAASTPEGPRHRGSAFRPPTRVVMALNDYFSGVGEPFSLTAHEESAGLGHPSFRLQRGPIGTGPRVVKFKEAEERSFLSSYHEKTLALETEAEAVARHFYEQGEDGALSGYIVLRAISDHADELKDDRWKLAASRNAVLALQKILPSVVEVL